MRFLGRGEALGPGLLGRLGRLHRLGEHLGERLARALRLLQPLAQLLDAPLQRGGAGARLGEELLGRGAGALRGRRLAPRRLDLVAQLGRVLALRRQRLAHAAHEGVLHAQALAEELQLLLGPPARRGRVARPLGEHVAALGGVRLGGGAGRRRARAGARGRGGGGRARAVHRDGGRTGGGARRGRLGGLGRARRRCLLGGGRGALEELHGAPRQRAQVERLAQVLVGVGAGQPVGVDRLRRGLAGVEDERHRAQLALDAVAHREPAHVGQLGRQQHEVRPRHPAAVDGRLAFTDGGDVETGGDQRAADRLRQRVIRLDEQQLAYHDRWSCYAHGTTDETVGEYPPDPTSAPEGSTPGSSPLPWRCLAPRHGP